jgi:hypothetical protein
VNVSGSGMVTSQFPEPGDPIEPGIRVQLRLRREAVVRDAPPPADGR